MPKEIEVTRSQWIDLARIVKAGVRMEQKLGLPVEVKNGEVSIEIEEDETKIILLDD